MENEKGKNFADAMLDGEMTGITGGYDAAQERFNNAGALGGFARHDLSANFGDLDVDGQDFAMQEGDHDFFISGDPYAAQAFTDGTQTGVLPFAAEQTVQPDAESLSWTCNPADLQWGNTGVQTYDFAAEEGYPYLIGLVEEMARDVRYIKAVICGLDEDAVDASEMKKRAEGGWLWEIRNGVGKLCSHMGINRKKSPKPRAADEIATGNVGRSRHSLGT